MSDSLLDASFPRYPRAPFLQSLPSYEIFHFQSFPSLLSPLPFYTSSSSSVSWIREIGGADVTREESVGCDEKLGLAKKEEAERRRQGERGRVEGEEESDRRGFKKISKEKEEQHG